jgi:fimbrial chaperone protein
MPRFACANYTISPVQLILENEDRIGSFNLTNNVSSPRTLQVTAYSWTQVNNKDITSKTDAIIINPPIFTLSSGETQLVRYALRKVETERDQEKTYRILITEVPNNTKSTGVQVNLELSLPLFIKPNKVEDKPLACTYTKALPNILKLNCINNSNSHVLVHGVKINHNNIKNISKYFLANKEGQVDYTLDSRALNNINVVEVSYLQNNDFMKTNASEKK